MKTHRTLAPRTHRNANESSRTGDSAARLGLLFAKGLGVAALGVGTAFLGAKLFGRPSLSRRAQDVGFVAQGLVLGGVAAAFRAPALAASLMAAPWAFAAFRASVSAPETSEAPALPPGPPAGLPLQSNAYLGHGANPGFA